MYMHGQSGSGTTCHAHATHMPPVTQHRPRLACSPAAAMCCLRAAPSTAAARSTSALSLSRPMHTWPAQHAPHTASKPGMFFMGFLGHGRSVDVTSWMTRKGTLTRPRWHVTSCEPAGVPSRRWSWQ